ncbi:UNKNOWN [Stylonychia lemnae]|uniref:Uncharacterized protein n=1 Tax=Stylonychia lemnae TaxID=5949 RepID=A0A078B8E6_STYLE|nr:UNKNOWN [Stylonychia lemnae]|eukprot:CDW90679.1 UNKNOWN [Stylonychia lemnae]
MSTEFKQQSQKRCISIPLLPKIIGSSGYVLSQTEVSEQLDSFPTEDENLVNMSVPDEYLEEPQDEDQLDEEGQKRNFTGNDNSKILSNLINGNLNVEQYIRDKQRRLQEQYQANEIIYEEEDQPDGFSTQNSALSRKPATLSNQDISQFLLQTFDKETLKEIQNGSIDPNYTSQIQHDIQKLRDTIFKLEGIIQSKQSLLQHMNGPQLQTDKSKSNIAIPTSESVNSSSASCKRKSNISYASTQSCRSRTIKNSFSSSSFQNQSNNTKSQQKLQTPHQSNKVDGDPALKLTTVQSMMASFTKLMKSQINNEVKIQMRPTNRKMFKSVADAAQLIRQGDQDKNSMHSNNGISPKRSLKSLNSAGKSGSKISKGKINHKRQIEQMNGDKENNIPRKALAQNKSGSQRNTQIVPKSISHGSKPIKIVEKLF